MPVTEPFLAKFATSPSKAEATSDSRSTARDKGTIMTKVDRETTDDR